MDPNETLKELRQAISDYEDTRGEFGESDLAADAADRMRDAAVALDEWLSNRGFLPRAWDWALRGPVG